LFSSLGSTRFLKVAKARKGNGYCVLKIFQTSTDPSLQYREYKSQIDGMYSTIYSFCFNIFNLFFHSKEIYSTLRGKDAITSSCLALKNCLPFQIVPKNDRSIIVSRPYIKDNLFDRLQTRPYLTRIEKKWIAFQLLNALKQIHQINIAHGDLKIENILLTSYNWIFLSDFASFKPTFFTYEDSAEYYYYFNASQRNICYLAPERFFDQTRPKNDVNNDTFSASFGKLGNPSMDIFSLGCILTELFTEQPLFTLAQMHEYRTNKYDPMIVINKIADEDIRNMVASMITQDPLKRRSADEYLEMQQDKAFPSCFYTFLLPYVRDILNEFSPDYVIYKLHHDFKLILTHLLIDTNNTTKSTDDNQIEMNQENKSESSECLLILLSLALSSMRKLKHLHSGLVALELLRLMIPLIDDQIILDRILPYVNFMLHDKHHRIRADAIRTLVFAISSVKNINQENADLFSEYLFPTLSTSPNQTDCYVRSNLAKYLSILAEHSSKFLERTYLIEGQNQATNNDYFKHYEDELREVQSWMGDKFSELIQGEGDDQNGQLAEALCRSDLIRLCTFFGKRKTIEIICGHLTTCLSKPNWRLRATLFDSLVTVASYIGLESGELIEPLLTAGLNDEEEFVVHRVLKTLACLVRLSLLKRKSIYRYLQEVAPLVCHPNLWLRLGVIEFINSICTSSHLAYVHAFVLPVIEKYFKFPIIQVDDANVLYNALTEPLSRDLFEYVQKIQPNENLFRYLIDRSNIRQMTGTGLKPAYVEPTDTTIADAFSRLTECGMKEEDEDKIIALKSFFKQVTQNKINSSVTTETTSRPGMINIKVPPGQSFDLSIRINQTNSISNNLDQNFVYNSEWLEMYGPSVRDGNTRQETLPLRTRNENIPNEQHDETSMMDTISYPSPSNENITQHREIRHRDSPLDNKRTGLRLQCVIEQNSLIDKHVAIYREDCQRDKLKKRSVPTSVFEMSEPNFLSPQGTLVGHIHVHNEKITKLASSLVSPLSNYTQFFATGDAKGSIRLWDVNKIKKALIFRPAHAIRGSISPVRGLVFTSDNSLRLASIHEDGQLNVYAADGQSTNSLKLNVNDVGVPVDLKYFNTGSQDILAFATSQGLIVGIDTRCPTAIFRLKNDLNHRLITSFEVDELQSWLAVGTGSGFIDVWDLRFQLCIQGMKHLTGARVISLLRHQDQPSSLISSFQGNNEVAIWTIDKPDSRQKVFWPSPAPPLSQKTVRLLILSLISKIFICFYFSSYIPIRFIRCIYGKITTVHHYFVLVLICVYEIGI